MAIFISADGRLCSDIVADLVDAAAQVGVAVSEVEKDTYAAPRGETFMDHDRATLARQVAALVNAGLSVEDTDDGYVVSK